MPGIAGFAKAVELNTPEVKEERRDRYYAFKQKIVNALKENNVDFEINGQINKTHVLNLWFKGISTYVIQTDLDLAGIAVSGGSACTAGSIEPSHVLTAMFGADSSRISESIRISFGGLNTEEDIDRLIATIVKTVENLKKINEDN